jgi:hypothetical protein
MEHKNSGRKDTGRTDKYSDESPAKDFADYRKDYPKKDETARKEAKDITDKKAKPHFIGKKSFEAKKQELISHLQNLQETFSHQDLKSWKAKEKQLREALDE